jgi:hypothetical protein
MTLDLSTNARKLIIRSAAGEELAAFAEWLSAERYSTFVIEQHLRRLAFVARSYRTAQRQSPIQKRAFEPYLMRSAGHDRGFIASPARVVFISVICSTAVASQLRHRRGSVSCAASALSLSSMSACSPSPPVGSTRTRSRISCREAYGLVSS